MGSEKELKEAARSPESMYPRCNLGGGEGKGSEMGNMHYSSAGLAGVQVGLGNLLSTMEHPYPSFE